MNPHRWQMKTFVEPAEYILQSLSPRSAVLRNSPQLGIPVAGQVHENVPFHNPPTDPSYWHHDGVLPGHPP